MNGSPFSQTLFDGQTVLVTGAGRGIGLSVARAFADHGARVIVHSGRAGTAETFAGSGIEALEADFSQRTGVADFIAAVHDRTDHLDVLVNNAGTMLGRFPAGEITDAQYDELVMLNQTSVVMLCRGLLAPLRAARQAAIVNTVSISARTGGSPGSSVYSATKAFVSTYTRALARELAPDGIRANAVSPGTIATDFHGRYSSAAKLEATRAALPLQRLGTPDDCAPAFLFLASPLLSGYITGQVLEINGGQLMA
ncbi:SDR family NAD(P)-dependent oxidoreductase [Pseudohoeflea coraliihabitans]|uniref:SDR family oxidoreductase n=1 Tax=Pseudohoeflea coraliihabitans TaxID=2860393 RepID=A0ABS6WT34_9HYPH|nr:SDR family oxidoreductase [Pseudohoeflea sp. DP4N28-3]MBW3098577.1 SDR family oxidoreductase [Pseudohoeflea sp. DP4N28-3]